MADPWHQGAPSTLGGRHPVPLAPPTSRGRFKQQIRRITSTGGSHPPPPHLGSCRGSLYSPVATPVAPSTLSRRPTCTPPSRLPWRSCIWLLWLWAAGRGSNRRRRFKRSNLGEFRHHLSLPQPLPCSTQSNIQWTQTTVPNSPGRCLPTIAPHTRESLRRTRIDWSRHPCCSSIFLGNASREGIASFF